MDTSHRNGSNFIHIPDGMRLESERDSPAG